MARGLGLRSIGLIKNHSIYTTQWSLCITVINSPPPPCLFSFLLFSLSIPLLIVNESNSIKKDDRDQQSREEETVVLFQFARCLICFSSFTYPHLPVSPFTSTSSLVHPLHFTLSCSTVLLKLPRWPLYLQHWSAHTFVLRKGPFGLSTGAQEHAKHIQTHIWNTHKHTQTNKQYLCLHSTHICLLQLCIVASYTPWDSVL